MLKLQPRVEGVGTHSKTKTDFNEAVVSEKCATNAYARVIDASTS